MSWLVSELTDQQAEVLWRAGRHEDLILLSLTYLNTRWHLDLDERQVVSLSIVQNLRKFNPAIGPWIARLRWRAWRALCTHWKIEQSQPRQLQGDPSEDRRTPGGIKPFVYPVGTLCPCGKSVHCKNLCYPCYQREQRIKRWRRREGL